MTATECYAISLDEKVDSSIAYFPTPSILAVLEVSDTTLGRHRDDLLKAELPGFQWHFYQTGCDRKTLEILWQYTQLVRMYRRSKAKDTIKKHMENYESSQNR